MKRKSIVLVVLILLFLLVSISSLWLGSAEIDFMAALFHRKGYETDSVILYSLRLPRLLAGILAGIGLSLSGQLLQTVLANPLASPNTVGVNAGAGLTVILTLWLCPALSAYLPIAAFLGAFVTAIFIMILSKSVGTSKSTVILAGIACTTLFQAGISFVGSIDTDILASYNGFSLGSFAFVQMNDLLLPAIFIGVALVVSIILSARITVLSLGDVIAGSLGIRVNMLRYTVLILASLGAASVISYAGLLGFVGLVVPHIARKLYVGSLRFQIIISSLCGAILVVVSDLLGRTLFAPSEVSVGIIMAFVGSPFFFILLFKRRGYRAEN